jgi:formylglycine-generating enzyme required for sulfatase activity
VAKPQPWLNPKDGLTYVWIPPGTFTMGCSPADTECQPDESPSHLVELPNGFWLGQTEVTNAAYHRVVASASFPPNEANLPVVDVSWRQAKAYCAAIGGRLPTEAEWEYAARAGTTGAYYGVPAKIAWFASNGGGDRHQVATRQPNAYGLYDMLGNASEWVLDRYYNKYDIEAPATGNVEQPLAANASALTRGGFWESEAQNIRVSHRNEMERDEPGPMAGIRCAVERK